MVIEGTEVYRDGDLQFMLEQQAREYHCGIASYLLDHIDWNDPAGTLARNWSYAEGGFNKLVGPAYHRLA